MSGSNKKKWNPEDGFDCLNTGKGTIVDQFDNEDALVMTPDERREQMIKDALEVGLVQKQKLD